MFSLGVRLLSRLLLRPIFTCKGVGGSGPLVNEGLPAPHVVIDRYLLRVNSMECPVNLLPVAISRARGGECIWHSVAMGHPKDRRTRQESIYNGKTGSMYHQGVYEKDELCTRSACMLNDSPCCARTPWDVCIGSTNQVAQLHILSQPGHPCGDALCPGTILQSLVWQLMYHCRHKP